MTLGDIATKARFLTNTDTTSYPDATLLVDINIWYQKVVSMILESQDESDFDDANITATYPIFQRTLAARRDYAFSTASWVPIGKESGANGSAAAILPLKIKRLDITYDNVNWYRATPIDDGAVAEDMGNNTTVTDQSFIREAPRYDIKYNALFIYPAPIAADVTAGATMRLEQERNVTPFTSGDLSTGTIVPGFDAPFHPMIADGAAMEYAQARQLPLLSTQAPKMQDWELRLRQAYGRKQDDRSLQFSSAYDDRYFR